MRLISNKSFHIYFFLILFTSFVFLTTESCKSKEEQKWDAYISQFLEEHIDSILNYSIDSLNFYDGDKTRNLLLSNQPKVLICVDIDCGTCIQKFNYWKDYSINFKNNYGVELPIVAIIDSENNKWNIKESVEKIWDGYWAYDSSKHIIENNDLDESVLRTLLIDGQDTIRVIGSPVEAPGIISTYELLFQKYFSSK